MKIEATLAFAAGLAIAGGAVAQDWGHPQADDPFAADYAASRALCRQLGDRDPPAADEPSPAQLASLRDCSSEALYYGIGMPADPERARLCAFAEIAQNRADAPFSGNTMLMTIYANGVGARRDLDVATHLACGLDGAPAEMEGRISHLADLKARDWRGSDFSYCDDITSGLAMGYCAGHDASIADARREAEIARISAGWPPAARRAYFDLNAARNEYAQQRGTSETDMSGTARGALATGATEEAQEDFIRLLRQLEAGQVPAATAARFALADRRLNQSYAAVRRGIGDVGGTVGWSEVQQTQRAWLAYRDAFLAFAAVRYPNVSRDSLATALTERRTAILDGLVNR